MPELPDLTLYARNLNKLLNGKNVTGLTVYRSRQVNIDPASLHKTIVGSQLLSVEREGKEIFFIFNNGHKLSIHLMLLGRFDVFTSIGVSYDKIAAIEFEDKILLLSDYKMMAKIALDPPEKKSPDALSEIFDLSYLREKIKKRKKKNIKAFLIDQAIVRGIGNAYADEILWEANISPESIAGNIPDAAVEKLYLSIKAVLHRAIEKIASITPDSINGEIRSFLNVHNRERKNCPHGYPIQVKRIASKTTYFTDEQIFY